MSFRAEVPRDMKWRERRRGLRLNSGVNIALDWTDDVGRVSHAEARTRVINPCGCMVVLPEDLPLEQRLRVTNLANQQACAAHVVWHGNHRVEGWELGIELVKPDFDFWGLDL